MGDNKLNQPKEIDARNRDDNQRNQAPSTRYERVENISLHDGVVKSKIIEDVELWEWDEYILEGYEILTFHDIVNLERCRSLVLSGTTSKVISDEDEQILTL